MVASIQEINGLRVAVEGCGHGTLNAIYSSIEKACEARTWDGVDLLIIGGDFQAVRNANDLTVMSCPVKYREIGDFHAYYSGLKKAPYLTIFVGGNHEASSHLWELYYGGWVAPNIYYMGAANVVRLGGVRIAGMSGIWKGYNYNKSHYERLPYNQDDVKSIYHVREYDIRKLLQVGTQVDIGISHDWPRAVEKHGDMKRLWNMKPDFERESNDGSLGNLAASYVMDRLRPPYWFAAHLHCKFSAVKTYEGAQKSNTVEEPKEEVKTTEVAPPVEINDATEQQPIVPHNDDEIDLDMDDDDSPSATDAPKHVDTTTDNAKSKQTPAATEESIPSSVPSDIRAQLPAAFSKPTTSAHREPRVQPGQPTPLKITNKAVRFLALDKCLPGRKFLQLLEVQPYDSAEKTSTSTPRAQPKFEYDPEWLAITRAFNSGLILGDKASRFPEDKGEDHYRTLIEKEQAWVDEHIVQQNKLEIPENFVITAPPFFEGMPEIVNEGPVEYNNPQMQEYCDLLGMENKFYASDEEKQIRMQNGPPAVEERRDGGFGGRGGGRGRGGRGGGRGFGGGRGHRGGGRGGGRGRGRGGWH
ncbi:Bcdbr1 [Botrytis cinerea B05.10]|uniref:Bcdbr1 n=1 Tax=Botryotinia fuckeliana (strain B05.10) TaxID=332648 RepID=A0A384K0K2_BOTFB|nr:Bcdbr1 [Botrytis cinerea B05.10]ATZ56318.1 Bcdbr1 [Botrytis cinerea B05.10]